MNEATHLRVGPVPSPPAHARDQRGMRGGGGAWLAQASWSLTAAIVIFSLLGAAAPPPSPAPSPSPAPAAKDVVDLNHASRDTLATLPGIGPKKADAIMQYRERHGFRRKADLLRVKGIGVRTYERLAPRVTVGAVPTRSPPRQTDANSTSGPSASPKQEE